MDRREVAVLVARGLSNHEIAARCRCRVRTVESHIYRPSNIRGVSGRAALTAMMRSVGDGVPTIK
ncbi:LuxR C-terminal-related transcriptional regulator [Mycobacterium sp. TY815]|uniref:LuxR C-terminal-related transcriptional regulator n=1 Tax=Mycobacterium sp. TY815 TaxID=3050581 RepID=UPI00274210DC|nr:LuxR C-terminal-related transcriptional regulator [Mycobacterium sp. TY815]MDP7703664.1 LuxR C-terminal-related transcriptional regulator [Mycobacterium sp. TY815]